MTRADNTPFLAQAAAARRQDTLSKASRSNRAPRQAPASQ